MYKDRLILFILTTGLLISCPAVAGSESPHHFGSPPGWPAETSDPYERVDHLAEAGKFEAALQELQRIAKKNSDDVELLWRMAYVRVYLGKHASSEDRTKENYRTALQNAEAAVAADSQNARAYAIQAMAAGRASMAASNNRQKVELSRLVKESADRSIKLDPSLDIGYHVRGRWHYEIATLGFLARAVVKIIYGGFPDASVEQAARDLERAIDCHDRVTHRLHLGIVYHELGRKREAVQQLERALKMPSSHPDDPEFKQEARTLLRKIQ